MAEEAKPVHSGDREGGDKEERVVEVEAGGEGEGEVVTMLDVLQDERDMEENAKAVLGGASETVCSYGKGYMARQPLYACATCSPPDSPAFQPAGVCLACSYHCHEGHSLVELYTKRAFRCDCGGPRLVGRCRLAQGKEANTGNQYNQNFSGLYCECARPYPDPEDPDSEDCMIQCVVCEDWHHGRHLGLATIPEDSSYAEMICRGCVTKHTFLRHYTGLAVTRVSKEEEEEAAKEEAVDAEAAADEGAAQVATPTATCPLTLPAAAATTLFLPAGWRLSLCSCSSCSAAYTAAGVEFLTQEADTVHHYEQQGQESMSNTSMEEAGMEALGQMGRVQQVEAIHSYNNMKDNLMDYLAKFASSKKVVREEDIKEFFEEMKANKKRRGGGDPPANCK